MKSLASALFVALVAGCATTGPEPKVAPAPAPRAAGPIAVEIDVTPRIGLFSEHDYDNSTGPESADGKLRYEGYYASIDPALRTLLAPVGRFDMLTTRRGHSGYAQRTVTITVTPGASSARCTIAVPNYGGPIAGCIATVTIGNAKTPIRITVTDPGGPGGGTRREFTFEVPEDFLIVSLGDSYASGEGNPDAARAAGASVDPAEPPRALWMDERCHRSMWAGPIQAGLMLVRESNANPAKSAPAEGVTVRSRGAYTIVSVACSGATIDRGVMGTYEGQIPLETLARRDPRLEKALRYVYQRRDRIEAQDAHVMLLLAEDRSDAREIDALIMSIGGNDAYFAALLETLVVSDIGDAIPQKEMQTFFAEKLSMLATSGDRGYLAVARADAPVRARQTAITAYPNPTYRCESEGLECYCSGTISGGLIGFFMGMFKAEIDPQEVVFIRSQLVTGLNSTVQGAAAANQWMFVSFAADGVKDEFRNHGWCLARNSRNPYGPSGAWFRDISESERIQGDFYGTMHPTWEGQQAYAKRIRDVVQEGMTSTITTGVASGWKSDGRTYYQPPLVLCFSGPGGPFADTGTVRIEGPGTATRIPDKSDCVAVAGAVNDPLKVTVRHAKTKRLFKESIGGLTADATRPEIMATVAGAQRCVPPACWVRETEASIVLTASDTGSGLERLAWKLIDTQGRVTEGTGSGQDAGKAEIRGLAPGKYQLAATAADRVGNPSELALEIGVDPMPPRVTGFAAYGHAFADAAGPVAIPVIAGNPLEFRLAASDDVSGLSRLTWSDGALKVAGPAKAVRIPLVPAPQAGAVSVSDWAVERAVRAPANRPAAQSLSFELTDVAGNVGARQEVRVVVLADRTNQAPRSVTTWQRDTGRASALLKNAVAPLTRSFDGVPAATDELWPVFAAWLNLADGRFAPDRTVDAGLSDCSLSSGPGASATAFALLKGADECVATQGRSSAVQVLLQQLPEVLKRSGLIR